MSQIEAKLAQRGQRFSGDNGNICMYIQRSKNANVVVYEAQYNAATGIFDTKNPLHPYWLDLEPSYQEKNRKKGKMDDRADLIYIEKKMAYGVSAKAIDQKHQEYDVTFVALGSKRQFRMTTIQFSEGSPKVAVIVGLINGRQAYIDRIYVETIEGMIMPKVVHVDIFGISVDDGSDLEERMKP